MNQVKKNSAEYRGHPEDYNALRNGMATPKSDYQKRMEELERRYSKGNFDKTPQYEEYE